MYWRLLYLRLFLRTVARRSPRAPLAPLCFTVLAVVTATAAAPPPSSSIEPLIRAYYSAMDAKNLDRLVAFYADDAVVSLGALHSGVTVLNSPRQIRDFFSGYYEVQGPIHHHVADLHVDGDTVLVHSVVTWTNTTLALDLTQQMVIRSGKIVALFDAGNCTC